MTSKEYLINLLKENDVFLEGDFTLSSGKKSNYYINMKKAITEPEILSTISSLITEKIKDDEIDKVMDFVDFLYNNDVDAVIVRFEQMAALMPADNSALFDQMIDQLTASEKPSVMQTIISSVDNYIISGGFMGLIIAAVVRREPKRDNLTE